MVWPAQVLFKIKLLSQLPERKAGTKHQSQKFPQVKGIFWDVRTRLAQTAINGDLWFNGLVVTTDLEANDY